MNKKYLLFVASMILLATGFFAHAGGGGIDVSGGGSGILLDGKVYLTDLYEAGVHQEPYINFARPEIASRISMSMFMSRWASSFDEKTIHALFTKLAEIQSFDPVFANALFESVRLTNWVLVDDILLPTADRAACVVQKEVVQVAVRQGATVVISKKYFDLMDDGNRVALFFHEVISSLANPRWTSSCQLRRAVAFLFSQEYQFRTSDFVRSILQGLPQQYSVQGGYWLRPENRYYTRFSFPFFNSRKSVFLSENFTYGFSPAVWVEYLDKSGRKVKALIKAQLMKPGFRWDLAAGLQSLCKTRASKVLSMSLRIGEMSLSQQTMNRENEILPAMNVNVRWPVVSRVNRSPLSTSEIVCDSGINLFIAEIANWQSTFEDFMFRVN